MRESHNKEHRFILRYFYGGMTNKNVSVGGWQLLICHIGFTHKNIFMLIKSILKVPKLTQQF